MGTSIVKAIAATSMAPVATNETIAPKSATVQDLKAAQPINPFYSPSNGDSSDDDAYQFAHYKVRLSHAVIMPRTELGFSLTFLTLNGRL